MSFNIPQGKNSYYIPASATSYVVNSNDDYIFVNTSLNAVTIYLPNIKGSGLDFSRKKFYISDLSGNAGAKNITIVPSGNNTVNGQPSVVISVAYGAVEVESNGVSNYSIEGAVNGATTGQTTGTVVNFATEAVYGTTTSPGTGNITASLVGAILANTILIIHNAGSEPTYPSTFLKSTLSGNYVIGSLNYIYVTYIDATHQIYSISQTA